MNYLYWGVLSIFCLFFLGRFLVDHFVFLKEARTCLAILCQPELWTEECHPVSAWGDLIYALNRWGDLNPKDYNITKINPARIGSSLQEIRSFEKHAYRYQIGLWLKCMRAGESLTGRFLREAQAHGITLEELGTSEEEFLQIKLKCAASFIKDYLATYQKTRDPLCFVGMLAGLRDEEVEIGVILPLLTDEERSVIQGDIFFSLAQNIVR